MQRNDSFHQLNPVAEMQVPKEWTGDAYGAGLNNGETKMIPLSLGMYALVDAEDFEELSKYRWFSEKQARTTYAFRNVDSGKRIAMHRMVMKTPPEKCTDHINGNGLDNRKCNLRVCTRAENNRNVAKPITNTSGYKGVSYSSARGKWIAQISINYKRINLGGYETPKRAHEVYCAAAKELHGAFFKG